MDPKSSMDLKKDWKYKANLYLHVNYTNFRSNNKLYLIEHNIRQFCISFLLFSKQDFLLLKNKTAKIYNFQKWNIEGCAQLGWYFT